MSEPFGTSDHCMVDFQLVTKSNTEDWKEKSFQYRKGDYESMRHFITNCDWSYLYEENCDIDECWKIFKTNIEKSIELYVPTNDRKTRSNKPMYWNKDISIARKNRVQWWKVYRRTQLQEDYNKYKQSLNRANKLSQKEN